jgi:hypothetical protein
LIRSRIAEVVVKPPADGDGAYGHGYQLLIALAGRSPQSAQGVFELYLRNQDPTRCYTVCMVLRQVKVKWGEKLLSPMLDDKRPLRLTYAMVPGQNKPRASLRVCDEAAVALNLIQPELKFTLAGEHADLDRQIAAMQRSMARTK